MPTLASDSGSSINMPFAYIIYQIKNWQSVVKYQADSGAGKSDQTGDDFAACLNVVIPLA